MWARIARFEGDPADVAARVQRLRSALDAGSFPPELADAKFLLLVDHESGAMLGVTLFDSEEAMRKRGRGNERGPRQRREPLLGRVLRGASPHALVHLLFCSRVCCCSPTARAVDDLDAVHARALREEPACAEGFGRRDTYWPMRTNSVS